MKLELTTITQLLGRILVVVLLFHGRPSSAEDHTSLDQRIVHWNEMRFGMLIHWGLYSQWGCHYPGTNGQLLDGSTEQMMRHLKIPLAQYAKIADVFNPTNFNADEWVRIAKDAGMKYIVVTAKHHDGFAMWDSQCSDYNIVKRTRWHRDPFRELSNACRKQGLKFGIYYSLGRDWEDPDAGTRAGYRSNFWDYPVETNKVFSRYFERKAKPQLRELLTSYGPLAVVWFDTPEEISAEESKELVDLIHQLQPDCIVNMRVGHHLGDYETFEQRVPNDPLDHPWESCVPLNGHWAYYPGDDDWKPASIVVENLSDITSKGGNCLLGIGPTGTGSIPRGAVDDLQRIGAWMRTNGESIYGTTDELVEEQPEWGRIIKRKNNYYLHVFEWPRDGKLMVSGVGTNLSKSCFLADATKTPLKRTLAAKSFTLDLPANPPDPVETVIVLH